MASKRTIAGKWPATLRPTATTRPLYGHNLWPQYGRNTATIQPLFSQDAATILPLPLHTATITQPRYYQLLTDTVLRGHSRLQCDHLICATLSCYGLIAFICFHCIDNNLLFCANRFKEHRIV